MVLCVRSVVAVLLLVTVVTGCRGRVPTPPNEGEGEGEGELPDPNGLRALVSLGDAVAADSGPDIAPGAIPQPADDVGLVTVDLGNLVVGVDGSTGAIFVDVDARVRGLSVVVHGDAGALVIPTRVEDGDGTIIVDDTLLPEGTPGLSQMQGLSRGFTGQFASPGRVLPQRDVGAFLIPSSPDIPLTPGRWRIALGQFDGAEDATGDPIAIPRPGAVRVQVLLRSASTSRGTVGLAFHFSGAGGLTASSAGEDASFAATLSTMADVYGGVAVDVDDVVLFDLEDGAAVRTVALDTPLCDGPEFDALVFRGVPDRINVFVIDHFECGNIGPFLLGLSAGLPAVPWAVTPRAGVVVSASFLSDDPTLFATTVAHEVGHQFGLYHSQENDRFGADLFDVIADTPDDDGARANLMFFDVSRATTTSLSAGQGRLIRTTPMVLP